jgi:hypothetical protein
MHAITGITVDKLDIFVTNLTLTWILGRVRRQRINLEP